jgi:hypothetical protein
MATATSPPFTPLLYDIAGIDVGGLFKDFLTDLSGRVFDPSFGLFCLSEQQQLYPHPCAAALMGCAPGETREMEDTFVFLGRVLGKGEGLTD